MAGALHLPSSMKTNFPRFLFPSLALAAVLAASPPLLADEPTTTEYDAWIRENTWTKSFLVVGTYRSYAGARQASERLRERTGLEVQSKADLVEAGQPTYTREVCEENGWDYPCYFARGRYDDGVYLSVEPSDQYDGMVKGYFVVIAASGNEEDVRAAARDLAEKRIKSMLRRSEVWMGCIH